MTDLAKLAAHLLKDLHLRADKDLAHGADVSIHIAERRRLTLCIGGLSNEFLFACLRTRRLSAAAHEMADRALGILETYNWRTLYDVRDVRFLPHVVVVSEEDYASDRWTPGVVTH
ncbi:hypothetical protein [Amycolatopsis sp. NPDC051071]|uniref:hypothetical protein n=1 Tax=Amycolatopsis sp. NPDC051071 TaxID=3154637 RepID=UPI00341F521B